MNNQLQKIFNIIKRTREKVILFNDKTNRSYVIMDLEEYENLVAFNEREFYDECDDEDCFDDEDCYYDDNCDCYEKNDIFRGMSDDKMEDELDDEDISEFEDIPEINIDDWEDNKENNEENNDFMVEDDFLPNNSEYYTNESELDRSSNYGKIDQKTRRNMWKIPQEVRNTDLNENKDEDRYYLEHI